MTPSFPESFKQNYQSHLQHLKLKGLQPKTIDAYSRAIRRIGLAFDYRIDNLSRQQLRKRLTPPSKKNRMMILRLCSEAIGRMAD